MLVRFLVNAAALAAATALVPGILLTGADGAHRAAAILVVAAVFGVLNTLVKPLLRLVSLPLVVLTLGLFLWVVNAAVLMLTSAAAGALGQPWHVAGWGAALVGSLVVSVVSALVGGVLDKEKR